MKATETRNPHNPEYSPGGSSSGSAAAVAAYHVPLSIGTQTNGSVIRPASFCGTYGYKPTRGVISRRGVLRTSESLDQVGVFARTPKDAAELCDVLGSYDPSDPKSYARPRPQMAEACLTSAPVKPNFVYLDMPYHDRLSQDVNSGMTELMTALGGQIERFDASKNMADLIDVHKVIQDYEISRNLDATLSPNWEQVSEPLQAVILSGREVSDAQYEDALGVMQSASTFFDKFFHDYDAILAPSVAGEAPKFGDGTGDPIFCTIWSLAGLPSLNIPLMVSSNGLPIGVQLIGAAEEDDRLFRTANWILKKLVSV